MITRDWSRAVGMYDLSKAIKEGGIKPIDGKESKFQTCYHFSMAEEIPIAQEGATHYISDLTLFAVPF